MCLYLQESVCVCLCMCVSVCVRVCACSQTEERHGRFWFRDLSFGNTARGREPSRQEGPFSRSAPLKAEAPAPQLSSFSIPAPGEQVLHEDSTASKTGVTAIVAVLHVC